MCVCVCVKVVILSDLLQWTGGINAALTVITEEDPSQQQEEQQGDHSSHSELHTALLYICGTTHTP